MPLLTLKDQGQLHYETLGAGPSLLLVAGLGGVASFWQPHLAPLAERFTVVLHDHRGTGRSSIQRIDYSVGQMAGDLLQLMDHLGLERAHLIGHSTGGAIGQTLALDHPARIDRLVLSGTWAGTDAYFQTLFDVRADILRRLGPAAYLRASTLFLMPPFWHGHGTESEPGDAEAARQIADPEVVLRRIAAIQRFDRRAEVHRIAAPTLVIGARDDVVTPVHLSEELGRLIPDATTIILPRGGHLFPQIAESAFRSAVMDFLNDV
jgi:aminoacrylate hydrolase